MSTFNKEITYPGAVMSPCKGCGDRTPGCHGSCKAYKEWAEDDRQKRAAHRERVAAAKEFDNYTVEHVIKMREKSYEGSMLRRRTGP